MAVMKKINCPVCGETKMEPRAGSDYSRECWECKRKKEAREREEFLTTRAALTIEERLARIEQWIYDYKPPINPRDIIMG